MIQAYSESGYLDLKYQQYFTANIANREKPGTVGKKNRAIMRLIIIIILTAIFLKSEAQVPSKKIMDIVKKIENHNVLHHRYVGMSAEPTEQFKNFIELRDLATEKELLTLLNYNNPVVKGYSSWALVDNRYPKLYEIFNLFWKSGERVATQGDCIFSKNELASEFYFQIQDQYATNQKDSLFLESQLHLIEDIILLSGKKGYLLRTVLKNNNANPKTYEKIRELANKQNHTAIGALGEYKRQEDIQFLLKLNEKSLIAISNFPDSAFWNLIVSLKKVEKNKYYYNAVSSFQNSDANKLLLEIYNTHNSDNIKELHEAISNHYCVYYQDLLLKIWVDRKTIDYITTKRLIIDCPEKASLSFAKGLQTNGEFNFIVHNYNFLGCDSILPLMLNNVAKYNPSLLVSICKQNIEISKSSDLVTILNLVAEQRLIETIPEIIERLNKKNSPYEIFHLTETLLCFDNPEKKLELVRILKLNRNDWDRGNWSKSFRELFKDKNIEIE